MWGASQDGSVVAMPAEDREGAPVGAQRLGKLAQPSLAGLFGERQNATQLYLNGEIPGWKDIRPAFGKKEVDLRGPAADPSDSDESVDRGLIGFS